MKDKIVGGLFGLAFIAVLWLIFIRGGDDMPIIVDGTTVQDVVVDGTSVNSVVVDGTEVWSRPSVLVAGASGAQVGFNNYTGSFGTLTPDPPVISPTGVTSIGGVWSESDTTNMVLDFVKSGAEPSWTTVTIQGQFATGASDRIITYTRTSMTYSLLTTHHSYLQSITIANDALVNGNTYYFLIQI